MKPVGLVYDVVASVAVGIPVYYLASSDGGAGCETAPSPERGRSDRTGSEPRLVASWLVALRRMRLAVTATLAR